MSNVDNAVIDDAWQTGLKAARTRGKDLVISSVAKTMEEGAPEYMTYKWWRMQAMLAWVGGQEVVNYAKSKEGGEGSGG